MIRNIPFMDENENLLFKEEQILKLENKDVLGEDFLIYDRCNSYTAKVISMEAVLFQIDVKKFMSKFPLTSKQIKPMFDLRSELADKLVEAQHQHLEYQYLKFNNRVSKIQKINI
jgi:hypothetical protein